MAGWLWLVCLILVASPNSIGQTTNAAPSPASDPVQAWKDSLDYSHASASGRTWWDAFVSENTNKTDLIHRVVAELTRRNATLQEFFLAYVYADTDNIQANLHFLDYRRGAFRETEEWDLTAIDPRTAPDRVRRLKEELGWNNTGGDARRWWRELEQTHPPSPWLVHLLEELRKRAASPREFFLASLHGGAANAQASLDYLDYARLASANPSASTNRVFAHPFLALRAPIRIHYSNPTSGFVSTYRSRSQILAPAQENRLWREWFDILARCDHSNPKNDEVDAIITRDLGILKDLAAEEADDDTPNRLSRQLYRADAFAVAQFVHGHRAEAVTTLRSALGKVPSSPLPPSARTAAQLLKHHLAWFEHADADAATELPDSATTPGTAPAPANPPPP